MSGASLPDTNCPYLAMCWPNSGRLPPRRYSIFFFMVVFPNITSRPRLSSRDRPWPALT